MVQQGKTIILVTHDDDLARRVPRAVVVSDGQVIDGKEVGHVEHPLAQSVA